MSTIHFSKRGRGMVSDLFPSSHRWQSWVRIGRVRAPPAEITPTRIASDRVGFFTAWSVRRG